MPDQTTDTVADPVVAAIDTVARCVVARRYIDLCEIDWSDFPELGEADLDAVSARADEIVQAIEPHTADYTAAYLLLADRHPGVLTMPDITRANNVFERRMPTGGSTAYAQPVPDSGEPQPGDRVRLTYSDGSGCEGTWVLANGVPALRLDDGTVHSHVAGQVRRDVLTRRPAVNEQPQTTDTAAEIKPLVDRVVDRLAAADAEWNEGTGDYYTLSRHFIEHLAKAAIREVDSQFRSALATKDTEIEQALSGVDFGPRAGDPLPARVRMLRGSLDNARSELHHTLVETGRDFTRLFHALGLPAETDMGEAVEAATAIYDERDQLRGENAALYARIDEALGMMLVGGQTDRICWQGAYKVLTAGLAVGPNGRLAGRPAGDTPEATDGDA